MRVKDREGRRETFCFFLNKGMHTSFCLQHNGYLRSEFCFRMMRDGFSHRGLHQNTLFGSSHCCSICKHRWKTDWRNLQGKNSRVALQYIHSFIFINQFILTRAMVDLVLTLGTLGIKQECTMDGMPRHHSYTHSHEVFYSSDNTAIK